MAFALAGYSPCDITVRFKHSELFVEGLGNKVEPIVTEENTVDQDEYPAKAPKAGVQHGIIVRGIARRNFKTTAFAFCPRGTFMPHILRAVAAEMSSGLRSNET